MGSPSFINGGEELGLPPGMLRRRGLFGAILNAAPGGGDEGGDRINLAQPEIDPGFTAGGSMAAARRMGRASMPYYINDGGTASPEPAQHRIVDDMSKSPEGGRSLAQQMDAGDYSGIQFGNQEKAPPDHLAQLQSQYDRLNQPAPPLSTKQKILKALVMAAPVVAGGIAGGWEGAGYAAQGEAGALGQQNQFEQSQKERQRESLLSQIEAERRMQEQESLADKRMTLQEQMQTEREKAQQASQERMFGQQNQMEDRRQSLQQQMQAERERAAQETQTRMFGEQEKLQGMRDRAADERFSRAYDTRFEGIASKRYETAMDAEQRLSRMEAAYPKGLQGDQQAMLSLLTDHIGMTLGLQKGARITKDILNEAQQSQPWLAKIGARFDDRGYLSGVALGPDQMRQMLELGYGARDRAVQGAYDDSQLYGVQPPKGAAAVFGKRKMGEMPALKDQGSNQAPEGTRVSNGSQVLVKRNGKWVPE